MKQSLSTKEKGCKYKQNIRVKDSQKGAITRCTARNVTG